MHSLDLTSCLLSLRRLSSSSVSLSFFRLFPVCFCFHVSPHLRRPLLPRFVGKPSTCAGRVPTLTLTPTVCFCVHLRQTRSLGLSLSDSQWRACVCVLFASVYVLVFCVHVRARECVHALSFPSFASVGVCTHALCLRRV